MNNKEKQAELYAEENNDCYTNDYYGFIAGWEACLLTFSAEKQNEVPLKTEENEINN